VANNSHRPGYYHKGLISLHNIGLAVFMVVMLLVATLIATSGFGSSEVTKEVLLEALIETRQGIEIQGKISGIVNIANDEVLTTATPITVATGGHVDLAVERFHLNYRLIRIDSSEVIYGNIHAGVLNENSYNTIQDAMVEAKKQGLVQINPYVDEEKPTTTSAFIYWIINLNEDDVLDTGELAVIGIVYADQDRPHTSEYLLVEGFSPEGRIFSMERNIPNISGEIIDLHGKIFP